MIAKKAKSKMFQKKMLTKWESFLKEVDNFLTDVGPGNVIEIIRIPSETGHQFLIWYWTEQPPDDESIVVKI